MTDTNTSAVSTADQALLDRVDAMHTPDSPKEPVRFAGKFTSVEVLESSYKQAESKLGTLAAENAALKAQLAEAATNPPKPVIKPVTEVVPPVEKPTAVDPLKIEAPVALTPEEQAAKDAADKSVADAAAADAAAAEALKAKQLDMAKYDAEYATDGGLSEASYTELAERGFNRTLVDTYIAGVIARATQSVDAIYAKTGGREGYAALSSWAAANVPSADLDAYNKAVQTGGAQASLAAEALFNRYQAAVGKEAALLSGRSAEPAAGTGYASLKELSAAMADARYKSDPAYRKEVEQKAARSTY